jgi:hypothetical protein
VLNTITLSLSLKYEKLLHFLSFAWFILIFSAVTDYAGGWIAGSNDVDQYIQVDMEEAYKLTTFYLQGQSDEPNLRDRDRVMVFNTTFNNISVISWQIWRNKYNQTGFMWPSKETLKLVPLRQVVAKYRLNKYENCTAEKLKLGSYNSSSCLIEVVTKAGLTVN